MANMRNKSCPCGSGMKYKYCCQKVSMEAEKSRIKKFRLKQAFEVADTISFVDAEKAWMGAL